MGINIFAQQHVGSVVDFAKTISRRLQLEAALLEAIYDLEMTIPTFIEVFEI